MARNPAAPADPAILALAPTLRDATDDQLRRVTAWVDALPRRGQADHLVAMIRPRLADMRPGRPLRFERLLFMPLDTVIVPTRHWRPSDPAVPNSVIPSVAATLRQAMGGAGAAIDALLAGHTTRDLDAIRRAGGLLWPAAGRILADPPPPLDWEATGIGLTQYVPLLRRIAAILARAPDIESLVAWPNQGDAEHAWSDGPPADAIAAVLRTLAEDEGEAARLMLLVLLRRLPDHADRVAGVVVGCLGRRALDEAAEAILRDYRAGGAVETGLARVALADAPSHVRRQVGLLRALDGDRMPADRREKLRAARACLDQACRSRFGDSLARAFLAPLRALTDADPDQSVPRLEDAARDLRALETEARALGGGPVYDGLLAGAAEAVRLAPPDTGLALMDRARLTEIILGADAAFSVLTAGST
jgi:hypothetical protein